jgi:hypothetical protein
MCCDSSNVRHVFSTFWVALPAELVAQSSICRTFGLSVASLLGLVKDARTLVGVALIGSKSVRGASTRLEGLKNVEK